MRCPICQEDLQKVGEFWICPHHGQVEPGSVEEIAAGPPRRVFVSYGRADALEFIRRLAGDLQERATTSGSTGRGSRRAGSGRCASRAPSGDRTGSRR